MKKLVVLLALLFGTGALAQNANVPNGGGGSGGGGGGSVTQGTSPWVDSIGFWNGVALGSPSNYGTSPGAVAVPGVNAFVTNPVTQAASENHVGEVGTNLIPITVSMTTASATTTTGQSIGGLQTLAGAARVSGSLGASGTSGFIQDVSVSFTDAVGAGPLDVYFFNANPSGSTCTNNSAFILANADRAKVVGIAHVTDFTASNTAAFAQAHNLAIGYGIASATSIFACVVARGSFAITGTTNASLVATVVRN